MALSTALIVDDSKLARITLRKKLEAHKLSVDMAESAEQAFSMLQEKKPDIVFMDHLMPDIDGFEATQKIRQMPEMADLPIVMCSGKEHEGYLQEAQAVGANQVLSKPPVDEILTSILATDFSAQPASEPVSAEPEVPVIEESIAAEDIPVLEVAAGPEVTSTFSSDAEMLVEETSMESEAEFSSEFLAEIEVKEKAEAVVEPEVEIPVPEAIVEPEVEIPVPEAVVELEVEIPVPEVIAEPEVEIPTPDAVVELEVEIPEPEVVAETISMPDPIAAALDEEAIAQICRDIVAAERVGLVNEIQKTLPQVGQPEVDAEALKAQIEEVVGQRFTALSANVTENVSKVANDIFNQRMAEMPVSLTEEATKALVSQHLNAVLDDRLSDIDTLIQAQKQDAKQAIEVIKASAEGLVNEALEKSGDTAVSDDIEQQLDDILDKQADLILDAHWPKVVAPVALVIAVIAVGAVGFLHFMQ